MISNSYGYLIVSAPFVEKTSLSPFSGLCTLVKDYLTMYARVYFRVVYSILLIYFSVITPVPHCGKLITVALW